MARGKKHAPAIDAPLCARVAYEQLDIGTSAVFLLGRSVQLCEADKDLMQFLAGRDNRREEALLLWGALQELVGDDDEYEMVISRNFLSNAIRPPEYGETFTRTELQDADDAVERAAVQLRDALQNHPDLGVESAALNWPTVVAQRIAKGLHGLHWMSSWDRDRMYADHEKGIGLENSEFPEPTVRTSEEDIDWDVETNLEENEVFNFVLSFSPTMAEMADVLARRARKFSSIRFSVAKMQTPTKMRFYAKRLTEWLVDIYPDATAHHVASICGPIVSKKFDSDAPSAFEMCKKIAEDLKCEREE
jgi:hypothetical protein